MSYFVKRIAAASLAGACVSPALAQEVVPAGQVEGSAADGKVSGQGDATAEPDAGGIVVTGSLIRGLPKEYVASPVFTYGKADIVQSGAGAVSEYMLTIPQNFTGDLSDFGTSAAQIGTTLSTGTTYNQYDGFASFALRGLGSDATLTLVNGRRTASAGMTESPTVSVLPSALIERIDIIPDGASATYGADAVAGVVNIVTRKPDRRRFIMHDLSAAFSHECRCYDAPCPVALASHLRAAASQILCSKRRGDSPRDLKPVPSACPRVPA